MVRKFGPFDGSPFYEVENRRLQRAFNPQTGFVKTGQGAVTAGTGAELVIAAYPDGALIDGLYVENPASETVALTTNSGSTNPRIDRLVMRLDMAALTIAPFQIVGTPAASPSAPTLTKTATAYDMPLCQYRFPGSASAQNPGSIVDERLWLDSASQVLLAYKSADTARVSSPGQTADPDLAFATLPIGTYLIEGAIRATGSSTPTVPGIRAQLAGSAVFGGAVGWGAGSGGANSAATAAGTLVATIEARNGDGTMLTPSGHLTVTTAGSLAFTWAQSSSDPTATTVKSGSWLRLTKVA